MTPSPIADLIIIAILALMAGHTFLLLRQGRWLVFDPLNAFWAGALVCYIHQPLSRGELYISWHSLEVFERTFLWILLALLSVVMGYETRIGQNWGRRLPTLPERLRPGRLVFAAWAFIALGFAGYAYQFASAGGASAWLAVGRGATNWESVSGYLVQLENMLPIGVTLLLFHVEFHHVSRLERLTVWALAALMWLWFLYLGTRSRTIGFTFIMLASYYLPKRKQPSVLLLAPLFVALLVLVSFQAKYRGYFTNLSLNLEQIDMGEAQETALPTWLGGNKERATVETTAGAEFNCVMAVVELVPDRIPYNFGYGHLEIFTRPIPRAIWPDKPYPTAEANTPILREGGLSTTAIVTAKEPLLMGPSLTFVGHWYSVGGPIALVIFGLLTGCMFRMIRTIYDRAPKNEGNTIVYSNLIMLGFGELAGEPLYWVFYLPITLIPLVIALYLCQARAASSGTVSAYLRATNSSS